MDNLTHAATGFLLSRAGLNRISKYAPATLVIAANAPDLDVVSLAGGTVAYLHYHRWITHSLVALPAMAVVPLLAIWLWRWLRKHTEPVRWLPMYAISLVGVASHLLLDWTNAYGIRLFLPWSDAWPALDSTSVIDVWIWMAALMALAGPWLSRLVSSEIGARRGSSGQGWAIFFLLFVCFYDGARYVLSRRALAVQEARLYEGETPRQVLVFPEPVNPLRWSGFVETDSFWVEQKVNLLVDFDPTLGRIIYKAQPSAPFENAKATAAFRELMSFSRGLRWSKIAVAEPEGGTLVRATDIRFGFEAAAVLDASGAVLNSDLGFTKR